jgi:anhydro-N-acetylmuramic acid kinase
MSALRAIGLMSGTSLDGIDMALIETDGEIIRHLGPSGERLYADDERALLRKALEAAVPLTQRNARPPVVAEAEEFVTQAHAEAVEQFMQQHGIDRAGIDIVGFHGQTVLHRPEIGLTMQIGQGKKLAHRLRLPVVYDMRAADMAAGGQGAPLVPAWHRALALSRPDLPSPLAVVNIGGVSNVTWIDGDAEPIAFDIGPGNALIDDLMLERTGTAMDQDGATAAQGKVNPTRLSALLVHPFLALPPPKSLDRNDFSRMEVTTLPTQDAAATLTAFTAHVIAGAARHFPAPPKQWVISGGGARNLTLMRYLKDIAAAPVVTADELGWSSQAMEAQAFAFLAVRSLLGLPLTFPATTGCPVPTKGGVLIRP